MPQQQETSKGRAVAYQDRGNFQVTQAIRSQILSRPWVTRAAVATKIDWAAAIPVVTGTEILSGFDVTLVGAGRYRSPTIPPGRLNDVTNATDHITLVADNFEVLSEELFKLTLTCQNGVPNAVIGPPTTGERVLGEL